MAENFEAVVLEPKARVTVRPCQKHIPTESEILVRTSVVSVSPFEAKMQQRAMYPVPYPASFGVAYAGTVESVGAAVTDFVRGDHVAVFGGGYQDGNLRRGAHQRFVICHPSDAAKVERTADPDQIATLMSNITTVVPMLSIKAGLDRPSPRPNVANREKKVLVYGGTTQLGRLCVQYAKSAGYHVVTTTSPKNAAITAALSPDIIVDHTVEPADVTGQLIDHGPYIAVFDTVSSAQTQAILASVMRENAIRGESNVVWAVGPASTLHEGVEFILHSYPSLLNSESAGPELKKWLYEEYVPGLFGGTFPNVPAAVEKVSGGLNAVQGMYDRVLNMSGKKLVYSPWDD